MSLLSLDVLARRMVPRGRIAVIDTDGSTRTFTGAAPGPSITIKIHNPRFKLQLIRNPKLKLGEGYMDGDFTIEEGTLKDLLDVVMSAVPPTDAPGAFGRFVRRIKAAVHDHNNLRRSSQNVQHHYDIDHKLYELFLDADMQYSCAYWRDGVTSLEQAQIDKKRHIAGKLRLEPGMRVLDIGSGWGGLGLHLAREHGVHVTGVTLSVDQHQTSVRRAKESGLEDRADFRLMDYRDVTGTFDRIVSVGMFEHVGYRHFAQYFEHLTRLLKPDGVALVHTIAKIGPMSGINPWMEKYIFPGAYLPALSQLAPIIEEQKLWLTDVEMLRLHYAKTLQAWDDRFQARRAEVAAMFDERFCRMWEFYLQGNVIGFQRSGMMVLQMQLAKQIDTLPITRDYMYAAALASDATHAAVAPAATNDAVPASPAAAERRWPTGKAGTSH